LKSNASTL